MLRVDSSFSVFGDASFHTPAKTTVWIDALFG
jgi:hypothetical protein